MNPIFVGGCDRSGTTLLGSMLGTHSQCLTVPEAQFVVQVWHEAVRERRQHDLQTIFTKICQHWRFQLWQLQLQMSDVPEELWTGAYSDLIRWLVQTYGRQHGKVAPIYWIDHTPTNTRYAATLFEQFPDAKMIHIVRDGRAIAASILPLDWGPNTIIKATTWWVEKVAHGLAAETFFGPDKVKRVRYEDLVSHAEITLRQLCDFIGLSFEPAMIDGEGFKVPEYTTQQHNLVGKPPDVSRLDAWRQQLSRRQIETVEALSGDFLQHLGYEPLYGPQAIPVSAVELIWQEISEPIRRETINRFKRTRRINSHVPKRG